MRTWPRAAIIVGASYAIESVLLALPTTHVPQWRLATWAIAGAILSTHIAYERFRLDSPPLQAAWHVGLGGAIGGFGIALAANLHSFYVETPARNATLLRLSLLLWPLVTGIPSFLVAGAAQLILPKRR